MTDDTTTSMSLDEIRARWAAATPGPWRRAWHGVWEVEAPPNQLVADCGTIGRAKEDATAIAHAPADIAFLLAEVARLRCLVTLAQDAVTDADPDAHAAALARLRAALEARHG